MPVYGWPNSLHDVALEIICAMYREKVDEATAIHQEEEDQFMAVDSNEENNQNAVNVNNAAQISTEAQAKQVCEWGEMVPSGIKDAIMEKIFKVLNSRQDWAMAHDARAIDRTYRMWVDQLVKTLQDQVLLTCEALKLIRWAAPDMATVQRRIVKTLATASLSNTTHINLWNVATDEMCKLIARHKENLELLTLDNSAVTDVGIYYLAGSDGATAHMFTPADYEIKHKEEADYSLGDPDPLLFATDYAFPWRAGSEPSQMLNALPEREPGCRKLKILNLKDCKSVSREAMWWFFQCMDSVGVVPADTYEYNVTRLLLRRLQEMPMEEAEDAQVGIRLGLRNLEKEKARTAERKLLWDCLDETMLRKVRLCCPNLTILRMACKDSQLKPFVALETLKKVSLDLEDYVGEGVFNFFKARGHRLNYVDLTCSEKFPPVDGDDDDAKDVVLLFHTVLKIVNEFCAGGELLELKISGKGLVDDKSLRSLFGELQKKTREEMLMRVLKTLHLTRVVTSTEQRVETRHRDDLLNFLAHCPALEDLRVDSTLASFMKAVMSCKLLWRHPLRELQILHTYLSMDRKYKDAAETDFALIKDNLSCFDFLDKVRQLKLTPGQLKAKELSVLTNYIQTRRWDLKVCEDIPVGMTIQ